MTLLSPNLPKLESNVHHKAELSDKKIINIPKLYASSFRAWFPLCTLIDFDIQGRSGGYIVNIDEFTSAHRPHNFGFAFPVLLGRKKNIENVFS